MLLSHGRRFPVAHRFRDVLSSALAAPSRGIHLRSRLPEPTATGAPPANPEGEAAAIRQLIAGGAHKRAVERAKAHLASCPGEQAEGLLADAYIARALAFEPSMFVEASAVLELVGTRCPSARGRLEGVRRLLAVRCGRLDDVLRPLAGATAPEETAAASSDLLRRELTHLGGLARSQALPAGHPLRLAAAALERAFEAATSRPLREEELGLEAVPRRSPLAPWKPLVRALACFHARDDEACERQLAAIDPDSAPARLIPVLRGLMRGSGLSGAAEKLGPLLSGRPPELHEALRRLDQALGSGRPRDVLHAVRDAVVQCRSARPDLLEPLRQRIAARATRRGDLERERLRAALGGELPRDAGYWRLHALGAEQRNERVSALVGWELFRLHAIQEGWLRERGPEEAALLLRMAELAATLGSEHAKAMRDRIGRFLELLEIEYQDQPPGAQQVARAAADTLEGAFDPAHLYREAAARDPRREAFERWLAWARRRSEWQPADEAALAWHAAWGEDTAPLLFLMESAERRGSFKKALGFLRMAEGLDRLNPQVALARLRLQVAIARRQLARLRSDLARRAVDELAATAGSERGQALVLALRWVCSVLDRDGGAESLREALAAAWGGEASAAVLLDGVAAACGLSPEPAPSKEVLAPVAGACGLGDAFGLPIPILAGWEPALLEELGGRAPRASASDLRALAGAALRGGRKELAYAAAGSGLGLPERPCDAVFLMLRARSLPQWTPRRARECLAGAAELARRQRDTELLAEIVAADPFAHQAAPGLPSLDALPAARLQEVLDRERTARGYPAWERDREAPLPCGCPICGAGERSDALDGRIEDSEDSEDDDLDDDRVVDGDDADRDDEPQPLDWRDLKELRSYPPKLAALLLELAAKHADPEDLERKDPVLAARLDRVLLELAASGWTPPGIGRRRGRNRRRR